MNKKSLTELDYYRIKEEISHYCASAEGKSEILSREPFTAFSKYEHLKNLSREANKCFSTSKGFYVSSWPEIRPLFATLRTNGARLDLDELYALGLFCQSQIKITGSIKTSAQSLGLKKLPELVTKMPSLEDSSKIIFSILTPDGELKDLASIKEIKKNIASLKTQIESTIHKYTIDANLSGVLESNVPALRQDRQLLAVKSSKRSLVKGIVHEVSTSGQTVYIEPEDVVKLNNDLIAEEYRLQEEIKKILLEATVRLADHVSEFEENLTHMITLDTIVAAARWGSENNCTYALPCGDEKLSGISKTAGTSKENITSNAAGTSSDTNLVEPPLLLGARHPLLGSKAVPIDIRFMTGKNVLIITGPNTGGKTVTLKTFALFVALNQTGFPIPALEGTRLPIFTDIFCDIGDEQSLDQNLSTFSGHMKNVADALTNATKTSLVLLDELGSGTDPLEGSAIAMATLDILIERGSFVLVTTHHGVLKNYGYTNESCINASVEFNSDTLSPTYRLIMGVPGESHALDIAEKNGLPLEAITKAKSYINTEQADISTLITGLTKKHKEVDDLIAQYKEKENKINQKIEKTSSREQNIKRREHDLKIAENKKELAFLKDARKRLENLVRELKEGEITREKTLKVKDFIADLTESIEGHADILEAEERNLNKYDRKIEAKKNGTAADANSTNAKKEFTEGDEVFSGTSKTRGTIIKKDKKDSWLVQFGALKMSVSEKELTLAPKSNQSLTPIVSYELAKPDEVQKTFATTCDFAPSLSGIPTDKPVFELRLLGLRVEEALKLLERQLDLCAIQNFHDFSIIHGKGTGALQSAVQEYLASYPGIQDFHFAPPEDGGTGKTYVRL